MTTMSTPTDRMAALTRMLAEAPAEAAEGLQDLCKQSARKAVYEVLDVLFDGAQRDPMNGVIRLRYTEFSEPLIERTVSRANEGCCD